MSEWFLRVRWSLRVFRRGQPLGLLAKVRWLWWRHIRNYPMEMCHRCGRPVARTLDSWWHAPDALWAESGGPAFGVVCPPCFTDLARDNGRLVYWVATEADYATHIRPMALNHPRPKAAS